MGPGGAAERPPLCLWLTLWEAPLGLVPLAIKPSEFQYINVVPFIFFFSLGLKRSNGRGPGRSLEAPLGLVPLANPLSSKAEMLCHLSFFFSLGAAMGAGPASYCFVTKRRQIFMPSWSPILRLGIFSKSSRPAAHCFKKKITVEGSLQLSDCKKQKRKNRKTKSEKVSIFKL